MPATVPSAETSDVQPQQIADQETGLDMAQPTSRQAVVVLGMHRSGTSALAGVLARLGCDLPEQVMPANEFNPRGYYESLGVYTHNDALLRTVGSSWADWRSLEPDWLDTTMGRAELVRGCEMLQEAFAASALFVLKDPRICRLMPYWRALFASADITPIYLHAHRSPVEVARSLETREGWPLEQGLLLWLRHELEAEQGSRGAQRAFVSYEGLLADWRGVAQQITVRSGLVFPNDIAAVEDEVDSFLSSSLRHTVESLNSPSELINRWVGGTHEILHRWAKAGEQAGDYARLDAIRAELDQVQPVFGPITAAQLAALARVDVDRQAERNHAAMKYQELVDQMAAQKKSARLARIRAREGFEAELAAAVAALRHQADLRMDRQSQALLDVTAEHDRLKAQLRHKEGELSRMMAQRDLNVAAREELEQREEALLSSTSWRLTAPLRLVMRALVVGPRRVLGALRRRLLARVRG